MILLYHLVFPDSTPKDAWNAGLILRLSDFKRQCLWIKKRYQFVSLSEYLDGLGQDQNYARAHFSLTFDDGYSRVFDLISPFLLEQQIPVTFFSTTSHLEDGELLWFVYFNALCSEKVYQKIEFENASYPLTSYKSSIIAWQKLVDSARISAHPIEFAREFAKKYPLPADVIKKYQGITETQMALIGKSVLFELGGHTHSHPYLDQISKSEQFQQMRTNRQILEQTSNKKVRFFAYTGGIYNMASVEAAKNTGFEAAFAIKPRNLSSDWLYEIPRVDIYSASLVKFKIKALGFEKAARFIIRKG